MKLVSPPSLLVFTDKLIKRGFHMSRKSQTIGDFNFCRTFQILLIIARAQLFNRLALNLGLNLTPVSFFLRSKVFSRTIFSVIFRASNHQLVDKKN